MTTIYVTGQCLLTEIRSLRGRMQLAELSHNAKMRLMKALMMVLTKALTEALMEALMKALMKALMMVLMMELIQVSAASLTLSLKKTRFRFSKTSNMVKLKTK